MAKVEKTRAAEVRLFMVDVDASSGRSFSEMEACVKGTPVWAGVYRSLCLCSKKPTCLSSGQMRKLEAVQGAGGTTSSGYIAVGLDPPKLVSAYILLIGEAERPTAPNLISQCRQKRQGPRHAIVNSYQLTCNLTETFYMTSRRSQLLTLS